MSDTDIVARDGIIRRAVQGGAGGCMLRLDSRLDGGFAVPLTLLLACLAYAEQEMLVPPAPRGWWRLAHEAQSAPPASTSGLPVARLAYQGVVDHSECLRCDEYYMFRVRVGVHAREIGLRCVLACLAFAQHEDELPALPDEWWLSIQRRY